MHAGKKLFLTSDGKRKLHIFCYNGESKVLITVFKTVEVRLYVRYEKKVCTSFKEISIPCLHILILDILYIDYNA